MSPEAVRPARLALAALSAAALALGLYAQVLRHAFVDIDVAPYVTQNRAVLSGLTWDGLAWAFTTFHAANWHPLTWLSHMLDVQMFGLAPAGHHAVNALLHAACSALVVLVLARATGDLAPSWFCGLAFAAHPLHAESVAWIAERKDVLSGALGLASVLAWLGWARRGSRAAWWTALALFALGLLAKPMLVTLPCVLLVLDGWPLRRLQRGARALLVEKLPFFALALASSALTVLAQRAGGAVQDLDRLPLAARAANALVAWAAYLRRVAWPGDLCFYYPYPKDGHGALAVALAAALLAAVSALALAQRARRPWILAGWLVFLGMLVPVIGLVQVGGQALADRYMYLPLLGILVALAWTARDLVRPPALRVALAVAAVAALSAVAWRQIGTWRDSVALAERALAVTRENHVAQNLLGFALGRHGETQAALEHLSEAVRIEPGDLEARDNLAVVQFQLGRGDEAEQHLRAVLRANPEMAKAREHLGAVLLARGELAEARAHLEEAVRLAPGSAGALANLGDALDRLGDRPAARAALERVLLLDADDVRALVGLARIDLDEGRLAPAAARLERALRVQPANPQALQQRARLRVAQGDERGAAADLRASIAARPAWLLPRIELSWLLACAEDAALRSPGEARALADDAVQRSGGGNAAALDALALALAAQGDFGGALPVAERARQRAQESGDGALAGRIARRLEAYRAGRVDRSVPR
jgi:tetratricopeptide (TPR) repeat protein